MNLHFVKATKIFMQTMPFVLLRMAVGILMGLLAIAFLGAVLLVMYFIGDSASGVIVLIALVIGIVAFAGIMRLARRYLLYMVTAGHIAVIAHIVDTGEAPDGQISYGMGKVKDNFASATALFAVDQVVKTVIKQFNSAVASFSSFVGFVPALKNIVEILRRAIAMAASYIDEAILAYIFLHEDQNNWRAARDGVVLYAKSWKPVLTATIIIVLALYAVSFVGILVLLPVAGVLGNLSPTLEIMGWAIVAGIGLTGYLGFLRPWVKTVVITTFLIESRDLSPDSETMDWVESKSSRFSELMERADSEEGDVDSPDPSREPGPKPSA